MNIEMSSWPRRQIQKVVLLGAAFSEERGRWGFPCSNGWTSFPLGRWSMEIWIAVVDGIKLDAEERRINRRFLKAIYIAGQNGRRCRNYHNFTSSSFPVLFTRTLRYTNRPPSSEKRICKVHPFVRPVLSPFVWPARRDEASACIGNNGEGDSAAASATAGKWNWIDWIW